MFQLAHPCCICSMVVLRLILLITDLFIKFLCMIMPRKKTITFVPMPKRAGIESSSEATPTRP